MDSLLYVGAADDESDEEQEIEEQEEESEEGATGPSHPASVQQIDFAALQRAGYESASSLTQTATYKRLEEEEKEAFAAAAAAKATAAEEALRHEAAAEKLRVNHYSPVLAHVSLHLKDRLQMPQSEMLNRKAIDERIGYKKRFDQTGEGFRQKEKRKRELGQQNRDGNWVEEEKRRIRHSSANFDS